MYPALFSLILKGVKTDAGFESFLRRTCNRMTRSGKKAKNSSEGKQSEKGEKGKSKEKDRNEQGKR